MANSISISGVHAGYGAVRVIEDVSLDVRSAETVVLLVVFVIIAPNGLVGLATQAFRRKEP